MPRQVTEQEIQRVEHELLGRRDGLSRLQLETQLQGSISSRTLSRRIATLLAAGRIHRRGDGPSTRYFHGPARAIPKRVSRPLEIRDSASTPLVEPPARDGDAHAEQFETPDGAVTLVLSEAARDILDYVSQPTAARTPRTYDRALLDNYVPNVTTYLPESVTSRLHQIGKPVVTPRAAGTFARDILSRFLIDLSWASSRLEGNTYSRLDTERLIQFGEVANGKDAKETRMILNHKAAIELLADEDSGEVGINSFTLFNLHTLLSDGLMTDADASGRLRFRPVGIHGSVYVPTAIPQLIEDCFARIIEKCAAIDDPFEQAFFLMVHVPYLQPFEDVNKRVSRLAANLPFIQADLCPLTFVEVPERAYVRGTLGVYELGRVELLRDVFVWAYERSCQKYLSVRDSIVEPDLFRMRYRAALTEVIGEIVRAKKRPTNAAIRGYAKSIVEAPHMPGFIKLASEEFFRLSERNIARYRLRLSEYSAWARATRRTKAR